MKKRKENKMKKGNGIKTKKRSIRLDKNKQ